jgi:hypothetical protein
MAASGHRGRHPAQALKDLDGQGDCSTACRGRATMSAPSGPDAASVYACSGWNWWRAAACPRAGPVGRPLAKDPALPPSAHAQGHRIRRLRFLSGTVAAVEEIWLDGAMPPDRRPPTCRNRSTCYYRTRWASGSRGPRIAWARAPSRLGPAEFPPRPARPCPRSPGSAGRRTAAVEGSLHLVRPRNRALRRAPEMRKDMT